MQFIVKEFKKSRLHLDLLIFNANSMVFPPSTFTLYSCHSNLWQIRKAARQGVVLNDSDDDVKLRNWQCGIVYIHTLVDTHLHRTYMYTFAKIVQVQGDNSASVIAY